MADSAGRPSFFNTPHEFEMKVQLYFESIKGEEGWETGSDEDGNPVDKKIWIVRPEVPTITGLCLFLGFESRQSFYDYAQREGFSYTVKKARLMIEHEYEKALNYSERPTAQIFALKNLGWSDRTELDHTTKGESLNIISLGSGKKPDESDS